MENILYFLRFAGISAVCIGFLLIVFTAVLKLRLAYKNEEKAKQVLKKLQAEGAEDGTYEIEDAKIVVENRDGRIYSGISFPVEAKWFSGLSRASFHFILAGVLLFTGGTINWFENKLIWVVLVLLSFYAPMVLLYVSGLAARLLGAVIFLLALFWLNIKYAGYLLLICLVAGAKKIKALFS